MGDLSKYDGEITITPPLNWAQIQQTQQLSGVASGWEVSLDITETVTDTETGQTIIKTCSRIVPSRQDRYKGYQVQQTLQELIDLHPEHTFAGHIERTGEAGVLCRYVVKGRTMVEIAPQIVWPEP